MDVNRLANLLGALGIAVMDRLTQHTAAAAGHGANVPAALVTIHNYPGLSIGDLAAVLELSHPGTVRLVDRLCDAGLVTRRAATDGRAVALHLERAGRQRTTAVLAARAEALTDAVGKLNPVDAAKLGQLLGELLAALTATPEQADTTCRLCDESICPLKTCPVECAIVGQRQT